MCDAWPGRCFALAIVQIPSLTNDTVSDQDSRLRELVLGYLDDHPTAMDTLDGIAEWWILRQQIEIEVRRVSRVLSRLVDDGLLEEVNQGGVRFFRRNGPRLIRTVEVTP